jgi:hypothetical protein
MSSRPAGHLASGCCRVEFYQMAMLGVTHRPMLGITHRPMLGITQQPMEEGATPLL